MILVMVGMLNFVVCMTARDCQSLCTANGLYDTGDGLYAQDVGLYDTGRGLYVSFM